MQAARIAGYFFEATEVPATSSRLASPGVIGSENASFADAEPERFATQGAIAGVAAIGCTSVSHRVAALLQASLRSDVIRSVRRNNAIFSHSPLSSRKLRIVLPPRGQPARGISIARYPVGLRSGAVRMSCFDMGGAVTGAFPME